MYLFLAALCLRCYPQSFSSAVNGGYSSLQCGGFSGCGAHALGIQAQEKPPKLPGEGNGNLFQYSCLGNAIDRGAWWATVRGVEEKVGHDLVTEQ